jgi:hypothetical protein
MAFLYVALTACYSVQSPFTCIVHPPSHCSHGLSLLAHAGEWYPRNGGKQTLISHAPNLQSFLRHMLRRELPG